jgi:hypothetical protein
MTIGRAAGRLTATLPAEPLPSLANHADPTGDRYQRAAPMQVVYENHHVISDSRAQPATINCLASSSRSPLIALIRVLARAHGRCRLLFREGCRGELGRMLDRA